MKLRSAFALLTTLLAVVASPEQALAFELSPPEPLANAAYTAGLTTIDGKQVDLTDYRGQVTVLNFWATWCAPCRREMPSIARLQAAFDKKPLTVLAVAVDRADPEKLKKFMAETQAENVTILRDTTMASMKAFTLRGLPATIVLDQSGSQVARHDGFELWDRPEIIEALNDLLAEG